MSIGDKVFSPANVTKAIEDLFEELEDPSASEIVFSYQMGLKQNRRIKQGVASFPSSDEIFALLSRLLFLWDHLFKKEVDLSIRVSWPLGRRVHFIAIPGSKPCFILSDSDGEMIQSEDVIEVIAAFFLVMRIVKLPNPDPPGFEEL